MISEPPNLPNFSEDSRQGSWAVGFTLVELMVVISIISLLIAILLPALSKARMAAQSAICLSKERQQGLAMAMYAEDNDQWITTYSKFSSNAGPFWPELIINRGYLPDNTTGDPKIWVSFACPTQEFLGGPWREWRRTHYALNWRFADQAGAGMFRHGRLAPFGIGTRSQATGELTDFTMASASPSDVASIGDYLATNSGRPSLRTNLTNPASVDYRMSFRHNGEACNVLYFDMHAGTRKFETIPIDSAKFWDATTP